MTQNDPQIEMMAVADLVPYARNSRTHDDAQVAQIAASIREFGFTNPVLIDAQGGIIAGHGRVLAARKLKLDTVPCIMLDHLTETQRRAYVIADNKLALNSGWDEELLKLELSDLNDEGFDLDLTGFTPEEILALDMGEDEDPEDVPAGDAAPKGNLSDRFMIPPFTVLNAREGWWQSRKKAWLAIGIKSELGRGGGQERHHTRQQSPVTQTEHSTTAGQPGRTRGFDRQRQAAAPGQRATTAKSSAATAQGGR